MQLRQVCEQSFPGVEVVGSNYPVPYHKQMMASAVDMAKMGVIAVTMFGENIFTTLNMAIPPWHASLAQNKMSTCMMSWFFGNTVSSALSNTGAFEVFFDGQLVHSKILTGTLPSVPHVLERVKGLIRENELAGEQDNF
mmetsp:Transcript_26128/g.83443  ORF Transcript_26128/g.83443 Transcript_26128/m.83443 type:complete len:139 (-) Transcript_26128:28-444(-)